MAAILSGRISIDATAFVSSGTAPAKDHGGRSLNCVAPNLPGCRPSEAYSEGAAFFGLLVLLDGVLGHVGEIPVGFAIYQASESAPNQDR